MKTAYSLVFAFFITGAFSLAAMAQEEEAKEPVAGSVQTEAAKQASSIKNKKNPAKKRTVKKKKAAPPEPVSEYKFQVQDEQPPYTFDKHGEPIVKKTNTAAKASKDKKSKAGGEKQAAKRSLPKLAQTPLSGSTGSAARYVCPMGEYEGDKPGSCPKCGMTLVKKR